MELQVILPERSEDELSDGLRELTAAICRLDPDQDQCYGLGGENGYGADFDNETFMLHRFCWCESESCPWCGGCQCHEEDTDHFIDGKKVHHEEASRWFADYAGPYPHERAEHGTPEYEAFNREWYAKIEERNARYKTVRNPTCDFCLGKGGFAGSGCEPGKGAPNFWHKSSGFKVWWYKWIGRDNELVGSAPSHMIEECLSSLSTPS